MLTTRNILLVGHIGAAILLIGPTSVAASLFPRYLLEAAEPRGDTSAVRAMHRITRAYGTAALAVPVIGVALAANQELLGAAWVQASLAIVGVGGTLLCVYVVPAQQRLLAALADRPRPDLAGRLRPLRAATGLVSLSWVVVLVLMVAKPS